MFGLLQHLFHPTNCYALCSVARSGAHLLSSGLLATHRAGHPMQYFNEQLAPRYASRYGLDAVRHFGHYVRAIVGLTATPNSVFGFRMESWDLEKFVSRLQQSAEFGPADADELELLESAFPRLRCIQLIREDKLRQAISKARAMQTDLWVPSPEKNAAGEEKFDPELIAHCLFSAHMAEEMWQDFFQRNEIEPLTITYENLCADYSATVGRVLDFLRVRPPRNFRLGPPRTVRQADATTEEWIARYTALEAKNQIAQNRP